MIIALYVGLAVLALLGLAIVAYVIYELRSIRQGQDELRRGQSQILETHRADHRLTHDRLNSQSATITTLAAILNVTPTPEPRPEPEPEPEPEPDGPNGNGGRGPGGPLRLILGGLAMLMAAGNAARAWVRHHPGRAAVALVVLAVLLILPSALPLIDPNTEPPPIAEPTSTVQPTSPPTAGAPTTTAPSSLVRTTTESVPTAEPTATATSGGDQADDPIQAAPGGTPSLAEPQPPTPPPPATVPPPSPEPPSSTTAPTTQPPTQQPSPTTEAPPVQPTNTSPPPTAASACLLEVSVETLLDLCVGSHHS